MIIAKNGDICSLTVHEHLEQQGVVYINDVTIRLVGDKHGTFRLTADRADKYIYIDFFALNFGFKEPLEKREGRGRTNITYGCPRSVRDEILYLPKGDVIDIFSTSNCREQECQYWSSPTRIDSKYAFTCLLARYRVINLIAQKERFTLEEVGRIYACTRERIRQIEEKALKRMRHKSRIERIRVFNEKIPDYRDYQAQAI